MMTYDLIIQLRDTIQRVLRADSSAIVATLVARDGHSYRDPGAMMVMTEALEVVGGVSGGCLEEYIGRVGRTLLVERDSILMSFDTAEEAPSAPTLGCGGRLEILVERATPAHLQYLEQIADAMRTSDQSAVVLQFNSNGAVPSVNACRQVVRLDDKTAHADGLLDEVVALRQTITSRSDAMNVTCCYLWPQPRLLIFGARDDAAPLADIARTASWHVTVVDRRARLATPERFPRAAAVICDDWPPAIARIDPKPWTAAVAMTHSYEDDFALLRLLVATPCEYIGVLGPSSRTRRLLDGLDADALERIHSPIGLSLGEKSPQAIAIAVMAELIAHRRGRNVHRDKNAGISWSIARYS